MGAVYDEAGAVVALLEVNRDMTETLAIQAERERDRAQLEREQMSARLVRAQRLESLGQLAGGIAHDFNNLLGIIVGYAGVIGRRLDGRGALGADERVELSDGVREIAQAAERAAGLTHQLLAFARQDAVEPDVIDVNAAINEMLGLLARTLGPHIELAAALDPSLYRARIDSGQLGQVLVNLAVNSREAMPGGGRLAIETTCAHFDHDHPTSHGVLPAGPYVRVRVNDSGVGMAPEVVERALDPFFTTRAIGEGTGLGLATVYGIITQVGGQVEIYTEPEHGTTVALLLPATDAAVTARPARGERDDATAAGTCTVLIVDDEPALLTITAQMVAEAGYRVMTAARGADAIASARASAHPVDLLLTDVVMPGMLGQDLAQQLTAISPSLRVVFMSGFARPFLPDEGRSLRGRLLQKPFTDTELLTTIDQSLNDPGPS
jgi:signal transduction histidine kinase